MSARAAARLGQLGFGQVYDYAAGKADWRAAGLPVEGEAAGAPTAGTIAAAPAVCGIDDTVATALALMDGDGLGLGLCVVTGPGGVVVGTLDGSARERGDRRVGEAMTPAPPTTRASTGPDTALERMRDRDLAFLLVTDPDGRLIGVLDRGRAAITAGAAVAHESGA